MCTKEAFRYKCPTCFLKYCSVNCFKVHKESPCQSLKAEKADGGERRERFRRNETEVAEDEDEDEIKVPEDRLARLRMVVTSPVTSLSSRQTQLRHYLSHSKLAQIIRDINSVPMRGRKKRLQSQID